MVYLEFLRNRNTRKIFCQVLIWYSMLKITRDCEMYFMPKKETDALDNNHTPERVTLLSRYA